MFRKYFNRFTFPGGAGGKGTWGRLGDELGQFSCLDDHDPNYDSEELVSYIFVTFSFCFLTI